MDRKAVAKAFNEWMRRYTEEPERFEREFRTVQKFLAEADSGSEPSYGATAAGYLEQLIADQSGAGVAPVPAPAR